MILIGYIGGRLCEGAPQLWVGSFDIFIWRPLDSFSRLITARRNPNLILLTFGWLMDGPDIGLLSVVIWHLISTAFLAVPLNDAGERSGFTALYDPGLRKSYQVGMTENSLFVYLSL